MDKIFNFFSGSEGASNNAESKLYEKFDEHKKETDAKIEKHQDKTDTKIEKFEDQVNTKIELLTAENTRLTHALIQHQNTTAQSFNTAHDRMNEQDRRINIIQEQMILSETQKQIVLDQIKSNPQLKQIDPKSAIAPPMEGEVEFLKSIIKGDDLDDNHPLVTQAEASLKQTRNKCIDVVFETVVKTSLNLFEYDRKVFSDPNFFNSIKKDDLADMFVEFSKAFFKDGIMGGLQNSRAIQTGLLIGAIKGGCYVAKLGYDHYQVHKEKKNTKAYWNEKKESLKTEISGYLRNTDTRFFDELLEIDELIYCTTYNRADAESTIWNNYATSTKQSPYITRTFGGIPDYVEYIPALTQKSKDFMIAKNEMEKILAKGKDKRIVWQDLRFVYFLKDDLTEKQKEIAIGKYRMYKAICEKREFKSRSKVSDNPLGVWTQNKSRLEEILVKCMIRHSTDNLKIAIKTRIKIERIRIFAQSSGSKHAKDFMEDFAKKTKYMYIDESKQKLFNTTYLLYETLTNTGRCDKDLVLDYAYNIGLVVNLDTQYDVILNDAVNKIQQEYDIMQRQTIRTVETITTETIGEDGIPHAKIEIKDVVRTTNEVRLEATAGKY